MHPAPLRRGRGETADRRAIRDRQGCGRAAPPPGTRWDRRAPPGCTRGSAAQHQGRGRAVAILPCPFRRVRTPTLPLLRGPPVRAPSVLHVPLLAAVAACASPSAGSADGVGARMPANEKYLLPGESRTFAIEYTARV